MSGRMQRGNRDPIQRNDTANVSTKTAAAQPRSRPIDRKSMGGQAPRPAPKKQSKKSAAASSRETVPVRARRPTETQWRDLQAGRFPPNGAAWAPLAECSGRLLFQIPRSEMAFMEWGQSWGMSPTDEAKAHFQEWRNAGFTERIRVEYDKKEYRVEAVKGVKSIEGVLRVIGRYRDGQLVTEEELEREEQSDKQSEEQSAEETESESETIHVTTGTRRNYTTQQVLEFMERGMKNVLQKIYAEMRITDQRRRTSAQLLQDIENDRIAVDDPEVHQSLGDLMDALRTLSEVLNRMNLVEEELRIWRDKFRNGDVDTSKRAAPPSASRLPPTSTRQPSRAPPPSSGRKRGADDIGPASRKSRRT